LHEHKHILLLLLLMLGERLGTQSILNISGHTLLRLRKAFHVSRQEPQANAGNEYRNLSFLPDEDEAE
jgi:hypothetical protein